jgi:glutamyl-tRNA synthetase/glutamyl-Q tRNA(Asp) synthetase
LTWQPVHPDLSVLASMIDGRVVTRFAPSPTGYLHLGHVVHAIYVWGVARALGGRVVMRIEDHDRLRSRREYETALIEDLAWLGFEPDSGLNPRLRQSETPIIYEEALARLRRTHHVYACECSRKEIRGERYGGQCRDKGLPEAPGLGLRVEMGRAVELFEDGLLGRQEQRPADQCGDLLVRDRDGHWTYQFAVTVDDLRQGISLVIRGADLTSSTGRQIALARMLGRARAPVFLHHPLIRDDSGNKLSKAAGDTGVRELRAAGLDAAEVIGRAAFLVGLVERPRLVPAHEVHLHFQRSEPFAGPGFANPELS